MSILYGSVGSRFQALLANWRRLVFAPGLFGLGLMATFAGQLLLSRTASAFDFGLYVLIYNAAAVLSAFGAAGFDLSAVRFAALANSRQDGAYLAAFVRVALRWACVAGVSAGLVMTAYLLVSKISSPVLLAIAAVVTVFWSLSRVIAGLMRGVGLLSSALLSDRVTRDVLVLALGTVASLTAWTVPASLPLLTLLGGTVLGFTLGGWLCARQVQRLHAQPAKESVTPDPAVRRDWIAVSAGLMAYNLAELFASRFDIFALSLLDSKAAVGALGLALLLINLVTIPSAFVALLIMPQVAVAYDREDRAQLRRLFRLSSIASIGVGMGIAAVIVLLLPYAGALMPRSLWSELRWDVLCAAILVRSLCLIGSFPPILLMMSGRHKALMGAHLASIAARVGIYIAGAAFIDANLAIIAFICGSIVVTIVNLWQVQRQLRDGDSGTARGIVARQERGA